MTPEELGQVTEETLTDEMRDKVLVELVCRVLALTRENEELWSELRAVRNA